MSTRITFGAPGQPSGEGEGQSGGEPKPGEQAHLHGRHGSALELMFDQGVLFELASIMVSGFARLPTKAPALIGHFKSMEPKSEVLLLIPANVLSAFALETYLKCFAHLEDREPSKTHNLCVLFGALDPKTQTEVRGLYAAQVKKHLPHGMTENGVPVDLSFDAVLLESADAFAKWRYAYENALKGQAAFLGYSADLIAIAVRQAIMQRHPEWAHHAEHIDR